MPALGGDPVFHPRPRRLAGHPLTVTGEGWGEGCVGTRVVEAAIGGGNQTLRFAATRNSHKPLGFGFPGAVGSVKRVINLFPRPSPFPGLPYPSPGEIRWVIPPFPVGFPPWIWAHVVCRAHFRREALGWGACTAMGRGVTPSPPSHPQTPGTARSPWTRALASQPGFRVVGYRVSQGLPPVRGRFGG